MQYLLGLGWVSKSIVATLFFIPIFIAFSFFGKNFGVKPEVVIICYYVGVGLGIVLFAVPTNLIGIQDFALWKVLVAIVLLGILIGSIANILFFRALIEAPNPSLPVAIINLGPVLILILTLGLTKWLPTMFEASKLDWNHITGLILLVIGTVLVSIQR